MIIEKFKHYPGVHCESTACRDLLAFNGLKLTEGMVFGLASGIGFVYWKTKKMSFPFVGGRIKQDSLIKNLSEVLNLDANLRETTSKEKAWKALRENLDAEIPTGLKLDMYYLDYLPKKIHFPAHYVVACGYGSKYVYLADTSFKGIQKTEIKSLEEARSARGFMSSKNLSFTFEKIHGKLDLKKAIEKAIEKTVEEMFNATIANLGVKGIFKFSREIKKWHEMENLGDCLKNHYMMWEEAGTGGAGFRRLYSEFLRESSKILKNRDIKTAAKYFEKVADHWTSINLELLKLRRKRTGIEKALEEISGRIEAQAVAERDVFHLLGKAV